MQPSTPSAQHAQWRERLRSARVCLILTPQAAPGADVWAALDAAAESVDLVQIRPKAPDTRSDAHGGDEAWQRSRARDVFELSVRALDVLARRGAEAPLVLVNDRVDVARALADRGIAGVHLGQDDSAPRVARALLGPQALIGLSTHSFRQVLEAQDEPVDYLGFGPVWASATKGYERGLGPGAVWIAQQASELALFAIGGVSVERADELANEFAPARAAVCSAILAAPDPGAAARRLRAALGAD